MKSSQIFIVLHATEKKSQEKFEPKTIRSIVKCFLESFPETVPFKRTIEEGGPNI